MTLLPLSIVCGFGTLAAILTISQKDPIHSALYLILTLLAVAIAFLFLRADFLAIIQVILYAGAIMVLIIFVILLTAREKIQKERLFHRQSSLAFLIALGLVGELLFMLLHHTRPPSQSSSFSLRYLSEVLFTQYVFPFEIASVLLLVSLVATIVIAKKEETS